VNPNKPPKPDWKRILREMRVEGLEAILAPTQGT
jgi:hypothetical protein